MNQTGFYQNVEEKNFLREKALGSLSFILKINTGPSTVSNQLSKYGWRQLTVTSARPMESVTVVSTARLPYDLEMSYPLVCRGAPSLVININPAMRNIGFTFIRGDKPASAGLHPANAHGKTAAMRADEPDRLTQYVEDMESLKEGGTLAPENKWYEELHSPDRYWTFMGVRHWPAPVQCTSARRKE